MAVLEENNYAHCIKWSVVYVKKINKWHWSQNESEGECPSGKIITYLSKIFGASTSQSKFTKISIITWGSLHIFSRKFRTVIFCKKLGWRTFSRTLKISIGKNIPISSFKPDLNLDIRLIKMEHNNWKTLIVDKALFFNNDKQRYCLTASRYLH